MKTLLPILYAILPAVALADEPAPAGAAAPSLRLPEKVAAEPGKPFRVVADTNCKRLRWKCEGVVRVPPEWLANPLKDFVGTAPAGSYTVTCEGSLNDEWVEASAVVTVGVPPPPAPTPASLSAELQKLYDADADPQREAYKAKLVSLWSGVSGAALSDPDLTTVGAVTNKMHNCSANYPYSLKPENLASIRLRLAKEISARVGPGTTPMDDERRKLCSTLFAEFVDALKRVK